MLHAIGPNSKAAKLGVLIGSTSLDTPNQAAAALACYLLCCPPSEQKRGVRHAPAKALTWWMRFSRSCEKRRETFCSRAATTAGVKIARSSAVRRGRTCAAACNHC